MGLCLGWREEPDDEVLSGVMLVICGCSSGVMMVRW